jgi:cytochrome c biogenesis protein CcdA
MGSDLLLVVGAVVAGVLTTLAPCVLPLLPVVVGGSLGAPTPGPAVEVPGGSLLTRPRARALSGHRRALVVTGSLGLSVIAFTVLLKVSTALIGLPAETWQVLSGGVLLVLGVTQLLPAAWDGLSTRLMLGARAGGRLSQAGSRGGVTGAVLTGAALGPVFSSCSPLYAYLVVTLIPAEPLFGMTLLMATSAGCAGPCWPSRCSDSEPCGGCAGRPTRTAGSAVRWGCSSCWSACWSSPAPTGACRPGCWSTRPGGRGSSTRASSRTAEPAAVGSGGLVPSDNDGAPPCSAWTNQRGSGCSTLQR